MKASTDLTQRLLENLTRELFQTETSASRHCRREAERLAGRAGARPLLQAAEHADRVLAKLPELARNEGLPLSAAGSAIGAAFSVLRDKLADKLIDSERSYRGTMLGMRHGIDLMTLFREVAEQSGRERLAAFCREWLEERLGYMREVEHGLAWFAAHPDEALARARPWLGSSQARGAERQAGA